MNMPVAVTDKKELTPFAAQFWGVDLSTGKGQNRLGQLLMQVRKEIS